MEERVECHDGLVMIALDILRRQVGCCTMQCMNVHRFFRPLCASAWLLLMAYLLVAGCCHMMALPTEALASKKPPPFNMKAYLDSHKVFINTLKDATAYLEKEKEANPAAAGMANYFLAEIALAKALSENSFDLIFLHFDQFTKSGKVDNLLSGYIGNRLKHLSHSMEDLYRVLTPNIAQSPYAAQELFIAMQSQLTGYQATLANVAEQVIPVP